MCVWVYLCVGGWSVVCAGGGITEETAVYRASNPHHHFALSLSLSFPLWWHFSGVVWCLEWQLGALWSVCWQSGLAEGDKERRLHTCRRTPTLACTLSMPWKMWSYTSTHQIMKNSWTSRTANIIDAPSREWHESNIVVENIITILYGIVKLRCMPLFCSYHDEVLTIILR